MTLLYLAALGAELGSATFALLLAHRRGEHRPAAVALIVLFVANLARVGLYPALGPPSDEPIAGARRVLVYLDGAAVLAALAAVPGLCLVLAAERRRVAVGAVAGAWLVASTMLAALYPSPLVRGPGLARVYLAADLFSLFVAIVALARRAFRSRRSPGSSEVIALALVVVDLAILLTPYSPWREGIFAARYDPAQLMVVLLFSVLAFYQGVLWRFSTR